jgi:hypothetical protein
VHKQQIGESNMREPMRQVIAEDHPHAIRRPDDAPPVEIPVGHVGPVFLPGSGRLIWWTGRVAIGLRHQQVHAPGPLAESARWIQNLMLAKRAA